LNNIEHELSDVLNRLNFIFKNEEITTLCIKDYNGISIFNEKIKPFEKNKKYRLKFFIARIFIENNILTVAPNDKCDNIDVQRYAISEKDNQKLMQRDILHFLNKIREFRFFMEKDVKDGVKPMIDLDKFNSYLSNIIDNRLLKLLRLSKAKLTLDDEKRLTISELKLYRLIFDLLTTWKKFFLNQI
jgi:hypothetical protein